MSASRALVVSSGMAALDVISRLLKPGDEVIAGDDLYGGSLAPIGLFAHRLKERIDFSNTCPHITA